VNCVPLGGQDPQTPLLLPACSFQHRIRTVLCRAEGESDSRAVKSSVGGSWHMDASLSTRAVAPPINQRKKKQKTGVHSTAEFIRSGDLRQAGRTKCKCTGEAQLYSRCRVFRRINLDLAEPPIPQLRLMFAQLPGRYHGETSATPLNREPCWPREPLRSLDQVDDGRNVCSIRNPQQR